MTNPGRNPLLLVLLIGLSSTGTLSLRAAADDSMEWQFSETNDPSNQGRMTARLIYGVPETDNIQVLGVCDASQSTPAASVTFGADIGNLDTGKDTDLRFSGGGFDYALKGQISHPASEEGLTGVHAEIAQDDPLWNAFAEKDSLDYLVPGYKASTIDLTRGKDKIASFLQACKSYAAAATGSQAGSSASASNSDKEDFESAKELGTAEAWQAFLAAHQSGFYSDLARAYLAKLSAGGTPQAAASSSAASSSANILDPSCYDVKNLRTTSSTVPTKLTVVNKSASDSILRWVDERGRIEDYGTIKAGQQTTVDTFLDNPWLITDDTGRICFQVFMPHPGSRVVEFTGGNAVALWEAPAGKPAAKKVTTKKTSGCGTGRIMVDGRCIKKHDAASFCGPGYRLKGNTCVSRYSAPSTSSNHGCKAGLVWSQAEGCHEDD
ncbi:MAG: hypothetical protein ACRECI_04255 [Methyloceanibacter sp.]